MEKHKFIMPENSKWRLSVFPNSNPNVFFQPSKNGEPNWFNRKMQELCFGVKWTYNG